MAVAADAPEITFPFTPPDDVHALVVDEWGSLPVVRRPVRGVDPDPGLVVAVFVGLSFATGFVQRFGDAAAGRLMSVLGGLLRRRSPDDGRPVSEVHLVIGPARLVAVVDEAACADPAAADRLAEILATARQDGVTLRWDRSAGGWLAVLDDAGSDRVD